MTNSLSGIHHVTAIAGDAQSNVNFYVGVLGLRLVKRTVNFDSPDTYHLYYGDGIGSPGTIMTFFPWPHAPRGLRGTGQATVTSFAVPADATGYWIDRLERRGVAVAGPETRFDEQVLTFDDPDGLRLELVARESAPSVVYWDEGPVPAERAIRGFHGVTMTEARLAPTDALLTSVLGFQLVVAEGHRSRYRAVGNGPGVFLDVLERPNDRRGEILAGTVHHVAWRTPDDDTQAAWLDELKAQRVDVTPVRDRQYFRSIYFREPGGVLFEIATDPPGFTADESAAELGTTLKLPPWLESSRGQISRALPPLQV